MIKKGVYAAGLSVINTNGALDIEATISHASNAIKNGLHGVFFFGSTGQSQLISTSEKKELIAKIASHKLRKQFFIGTGSNSLNENIDLVSWKVEAIPTTFLVDDKGTIIYKVEGEKHWDSPEFVSFVNSFLN